MGRKNSPSANKELNELIAQYETARAENRQLYLDGDQLADIADQYAAERKFNEAQEVITYGLHLHPDSTESTGRTSLSLSGYRQNSSGKKSGGKYYRRI